MVEGRYIFIPEYMHLCMALKGKGGPLQTEFEARHLQEIVLEHKKFQITKSPLGGEIWDQSHAESMIKSNLHQWL